jgi:hypothetical protein
MNKRVTLVILAIVAMAAFSSSAMATTITIANGSFEANVSGSGTGSTLPAQAWQVVNGVPTVETLTVDSANFPGGAPDGTKALFNYSATDNDVAVLTRTNGTPHTTLTLDAGKFYTFSFDIGNGLVSHPAGYFGGFGAEVAEATAGGSLFNQEYHGTRMDNPAPGTWQVYGAVFSADQFIDNDLINDGDVLRVGLTALGVGAWLDNVQVTEWSTLAAAESAEIMNGIYANKVTGQYDQPQPPAPTPEPSTMVLLASGLFGLLAYAWRKRK